MDRDLLAPVDRGRPSVGLGLPGFDSPMRRRGRTAQAGRKRATAILTRRVKQGVADLRRLYNVLNLKINYHPEGRTADIEITLTDTTGGTYATAPPDHRVGPSSQVCVVPPAGPVPHGNAARPAAA